jgi:hypothetical protein
LCLATLDATHSTQRILQRVDQQDWLATGPLNGTIHLNPETCTFQAVFGEGTGKGAFALRFLA